MDRRAFHYELPAELIAQEPLPARTASRLLILESGKLMDGHFSDLPSLLRPGDLLVMNDTRVLPARLRGRKATGGRIEVLLERITGPRTATAQIKAGKSLQAGAELRLGGGAGARVLAREGVLFSLAFDTDLEPYLDAHGEVPLPPYVARPARTEDSERYQTVYARRRGSAAAPTAGLHFDASLLEALRARGIDTAFLTLHVGIATFGPVRAQRIEDHRLHAERVSVSAALCERIGRVRNDGGRVVAVGTTTVRALESAARGGRLEPLEEDTTLFIYPGFRFRVVDVLVTNFHLPESSLLMLVAAFAGHEPVMNAYRHAVASRYRFFSYGDAMLVTP